MESSYSIHPAENLVKMHVWGELTVDGLIDLITRAGSDPAFRPGMNAVADLRESHGNWDYSEIQRYRDFVVHVAGSKKRRWAAVVKPGTLVAVVHITILISDEVRDVIEMELFDEPARAARWATGEID
ncbi:hypothetical protein HNQ60_003184 [Povalibacter uvarum]|uniref:STAS/SEC14 domain-containing protein n=1 Tax=Povalibacter uvarum TaxID=732238 RepID=A0A841HNH0_9GAMM|nr:hypothetical protein [Povalibacter uvarum]MBB6094303.1 hypothetical protein [Povalibacter uvarum]